MPEKPQVEVSAEERAAWARQVRENRPALERLGILKLAEKYAGLTSKNDS